MPIGKSRSLAMLLMAVVALALAVGLPAPVQAGGDMPVEVPASGPADACDQPADSFTEGADGFTAPAPTKLDASGSGSDGVCIPADFFTHPQFDVGMYRVNGRALEKGFHRVKEGVTSVTVTTDFDSGTWTFTFTDKNQGTEAKNRYWAKLEECDVTTGRTPATFFAENVDDDTNLPIGKLTMIPDRPADPIPVTYVPQHDIQDGETREIPVMDYQGGLYPGTWNLDVLIDNSQKRSARVVLWVPACGDISPPHGDHPPGVRVKPRASLKQPTCQVPKVTVTLNNRASNKAVMFRVVKNGKRMKPAYRLAAGASKVVMRYVKPNSKLQVAAAGKVLAARTVRAPRGC